MLKGAPPDPPSKTSSREIFAWGRGETGTGAVPPIQAELVQIVSEGVQRASSWAVWRGL